jgi:hypothetical protein
MATGITVTKKIAKFTGRPITLNEMIEAVERIIFKNERHVVLSYGA